MDRSRRQHLTPHRPEARRLAAAGFRRAPLQVPIRLRPLGGLGELLDHAVALELGFDNQSTRFAIQGKLTPIKISTAELKYTARSGEAGQSRRSTTKDSGYIQRTPKGESHAKDCINWLCYWRAHRNRTAGACG
jgi:hypothetical protein